MVNFFSAWRQRRRAQTLVARTAISDESGVSAFNCFADGHESEKRILWSEIGEVWAFKQDCYAYDMICVQITSRLDSGVIIAREEDGGFTDLVNAMPKHLDGCIPVEDWWFPVMLPAFETNLTMLWRRP